MKVDPPSPITPRPLSPDVKTKPVSLARLAANIAPGTRWAEETQSPYFMVPCVGTGDVSLWREADNKIGGIETFDRIFRDQLKGLGFRTAGDPTNLFEDQANADLQVGAVDHGNSGGPLLDEKGQIVALTVSGYTEDGVGRNINLFIPIGDALKALALTPAP